MVGKGWVWEVAGGRWQVCCVGTVGTGVLVYVEYDKYAKFAKLQRTRAVTRVRVLGYLYGKFVIGGRSNRRSSTSTRT